MLVIIFGLFHGVVFLPVILSLIGAQPYEVSLQSSHPNGINDAIKIKSPQPYYSDKDDNSTEMTNLQHKNEKLNDVN